MLQPDSWEQLAVLFASCVISLLSWKKKIEHYSGDLNTRHLNTQHFGVRYSDGKIKIGIQNAPFSNKIQTFWSDIQISFD